MKKACVEDFKPICFAKPIEETGQIHMNECNINVTSILTKLIQEAGRWCKSYASDLFITWGVVNRKIEECNLEDESFLFGFRETGVDHTQSILSRYQNDWDCMIAAHEYRAIWRLDVTVEPPQPECSMGKVMFTLYEVGR